MFTSSDLKTISFSCNLFSFFCVFPYDWNPTTYRFDPTKSKHRIILSTVINYGCSFLITYLTVRNGLDVLNGRLTITQIYIAIVYILLGSASAMIGLVIQFHGVELIEIFNNIFKFDKLVEETLLFIEQYEIEAEDLESDDDDIEIFESSKSDSSTHSEPLTTLILKMLEPLSILECIFMFLLYYENYDPAMKYYYEALSICTGIKGPALEIPLFFVYTLGVRIFHNYYIVITLLLTSYLEVTSYWLTQLCHNAKLVKYKYLTRNLYNVAYVFNKIVNESKIAKIILPGLTLILFIPSVLGYYGTIRFYGVFSIGPYLFMPSVAILFALVGNIWFRIAGQLESISKEFIQSACKSTIYDKEFQKYLVSIRPLYISASVYFKVNTHTHVLVLEKILDATVNLLMDFPILKSK